MMSKQPPEMKSRAGGKKRERTPSPEKSFFSSGDETSHQFAVPQISISPRLREKTSQFHTFSQATATDASVTASLVATPLVTSPTSQSSHDQSSSTQSHHVSPSLKAAKAAAKKPRAPRQDFVLSDEEEKVMFEWLKATEEVWNAKKAGYHKHDVKQGLWEAQAKVMNNSAEHLIGWFKSVRDTNTRLIKKGKGKLGDGNDDDEIWTDRQRFIMASMKFMDRVVRHRLKSVRSVEAIILEHLDNLDAAEAAAAQEASDVDSEGKPRASTSFGPRRQSIREGEMDRMLQLMQEQAEESLALMEELRKCKEQRPNTARNAFAAYVRDSINTMSEWSYRKAKDEIYQVLTKYEDGAEEERVKQQQQLQQFQQQLPHHHMRPRHTVLPVRGLQLASQQMALSDMQPLLVIKEETLPEHQEWNLSVDQEDIKEEEKLWISQQGEQIQQLEEADLTKFGFTAVPVKSENEDEKPESSHLHQSRSDESTEPESVASSSSVHRTLTAEADGEDDGRPQPASNSGPSNYLQRDISGGSSDSSGTETDDSYDWKQTREHQSSFNCQKNSNIVHSGNTDDKQFKGSKYVKASGYMNNSEQQKERQARRKPFSCSDQSKRQKQKGTQKKHIRIHTGQKQFVCSECGRSFGQKSSLNRHMIIHTGQKAFVCSDCGQIFGLKSSLNRHMIIHIGQKKVFVCSECDQRFGRKSDLNTHLIIHTGQKAFPCSECGRRFGRKSNLNTHMIIHTGQKAFVCSECGQRFGLKSSLNRHMIIHTGQKKAVWVSLKSTSPTEHR